MRTTEELFDYARGLHIKATEQLRKKPEDYRAAMLEAHSIFDQLVANNPNDVAALYGLATTASDLGLGGSAMALLTRAIELKPEDALLWMQLGTVTKREQKYPVARHCYSKAAELRPDDAMILAHLAGCYVNQGEPAPGVEIAERAIKGTAEPENLDRAKSLARSHQALCLLEMERWGEGWDAYEARCELQEYHKRDYGDVPRWNGEKVGTLMIHAEQGLGDEILFASILPDAIKRADRVIFECAPRLQKLFERTFPGVTCYPSAEAVDASGERFDAWDRLSSLGRLFRRKEADFPRTPFLKPDPERVAYYKHRLSLLGPYPHVGIAWKGGTKHTQECYRRTPRAQWERLVSGPATFISLQYGDDAADEAAAMRLPHWPEVIKDLDEFAALVAACDHVVTVCQTAVHFAGALGVPTTCITPSRPAWRYHLKRDDMLFYSSVRIARQVGSDWSPAFKVADGSIADLARMTTQNVVALQPKRAFAWPAW